MSNPKSLFESQVEFGDKSIVEFDVTSKLAFPPQPISEPTRRPNSTFKSSLLLGANESFPRISTATSSFPNHEAIPEPSPARRSFNASTLILGDEKGHFNQANSSTHDAFVPYQVQPIERPISRLETKVLHNDEKFKNDYETTNRSNFRIHTTSKIGISSFIRFLISKILFTEIFGQELEITVDLIGNSPQPQKILFHLDCLYFFHMCNSLEIQHLF